MFWSYILEYAEIILSAMPNVAKSDTRSKCRRQICLYYILQEGGKQS